MKKPQRSIQRMLVIWTAVCVLVTDQLREAFAVEITEDYIDKFAEGLQAFINSSEQSIIFKDETFDPLKYNEQDTVNNAEVYDFIIVGAGAAGSVIASRLSEIPEWKILLLEAGDVETPYMQVPSLSGVLQGTKYNWGYVTVPQDSWCLGMLDRRCSTATGKGLGGGTAINSMLYMRGNALDYELWAAKGNDGWSYADVLPYFKKAENCELEVCDETYHQQGGPLHIEETQYHSPLIDTFLEAGHELGYNVVDYNGPEQIGFSISQTTTKQGRRNSAARSYLLPYKDRKNLHVKTQSHAIQIIIDPKTKEAIGVKYVQNKTIHSALANKETIISAGPFNSAQLLMLSGIGPQEDLEKLDIPVISNLPVGRQLKDHVSFQGLNVLLNISKFEEGTFRSQIETWLKFGQGPLAGPPGLSLAYVKTEVSQDQGDYPDIELVLGIAKFLSTVRIKNEYKSILEPPGEEEAIRIIIMPTHPKSVGSMTLNSKDPLHAPIIDLKQFSDAGGRDIETMLAGIKTAIEIINTNAFQRLGARLVQKPIKGCDGHDFASDDYWKCAARYLSISLRHQTRTCKMGPSTDSSAVVDNKLRVYGLGKLRVADTSVVPVDITGHTHGVANMVGEKAADLIKESWI